MQIHNDSAIQSTIFEELYKFENIKTIAETLITTMNPQSGTIIFIEGIPGVGKSTLTHQLINYIELRLFPGSQVEKDRIVVTQSPTFTKVQEYKNVVHMDLFLMDNVEKYMDYLTNISNKILIIEWGKYFEQFIKPDYLIELEFIDNDQNRRLVRLLKY